MSGPLEGIRVVELQGRGPGPFGGMVLSDLGADVVTVARPETVHAPVGESDHERSLKGHRRFDLVTRGRRSVAIDLKHPEGLEVALRLVDEADVLVEAYRPGVAERLGIGPEVCMERNPSLVYARITGWGQDGPYAAMPGHDINYVALSGALHALARPGTAPAPPLNLLGDYGGGGMILVIGILAALIERTRSGRGQVVDAAMIDGVALLTTQLRGMRAEGLWSDVPGTNVLDLGAPFYNVYETADGRHLTIACGEPKFYANLLRAIGAEDDLLSQQGNPRTWPAAKERLATIFKTKTLAQWCSILENVDTCFAPVLTLDEAPTHPHNVTRRTFVEIDGIVQPGAAPRFSRTPASPGRVPRSGEHTTETLLAAGFPAEEISRLRRAGAIVQAEEEADSGAMAR